MSSGVIFANGQRIFCPEPTAPEPPRGSEIIIKNLPPNVFEDQLIPMFSTVGKIYNIRIMMDYSGANRGFGFIRYLSVKEAYKAVHLYNNWPIQNTPHSKRLKVEISVDNRRLYISKIPR